MGRPRFLSSGCEAKKYKSVMSLPQVLYIPMALVSRYFAAVTTPTNRSFLGANSMDNFRYLMFGSEFGVTDLSSSSLESWLWLWLNWRSDATLSFDELFDNLLSRTSTARVCSQGCDWLPPWQFEEELLLRRRGSVNCSHIRGERISPMVTPTMTDSSVRLEIITTLCCQKK